jgi:rRNA maturation endonuclease Nob1
MLISKLEISNMRKIKQAEIEFHGPGVQVIEGVNYSGKTTLGQSIAITMNGTKDFTPGMIRHGAEEAEIVAYTDDGLKIRTTIAKEVKQKAHRFDEGLQRWVEVSGGVRAFLSSLCSGLEQPWAFRDVPDADIVEMLMERSGTSAKIAAIDAELADKERLRTETGRDRKKLGDPGKPLDEVKHPEPIDAIKAEREKTREYQRLYGEALSLARDAVIKALSLNCHTFEDIENAGRLLEKEVAAGRKKLAGFKAYTKEDTVALDKTIADWYEIEEKAKAYDAYVQKKTECDALDKQYAALTAEIEELRTRRKKVLADMKLDVKGLEVGEDNMLYHNGVLRGITKSNKTANWSTAESVQVFFGLGARFAGEMKVLVVDNAESLDAKTSGAITNWAEKAGFLVIMLRVAEIPDELEEGVIYIREGEVLTK